MCSGRKGTDNNCVPHVKEKQYSFFRRNPFFRAQHTEIQRARGFWLVPGSSRLLSERKTLTISAGKLKAVEIQVLQGATLWHQQAKGTEGKPG